MASILDRYGIKEVADVTFYKIDKTTGKASNPVLYLDTLKVSTIEQTAETTDARGGKGNPKLVTWDYGKDITVTLEDALFSAKSLAIMFGDGNVTASAGTVTRTVMAKLTTAGTLPTYFVADILKNGSSVRAKVCPGSSLPSDVPDGVLMSKTGIAIQSITSETGAVLATGEWKLNETAGADLEVGDKIFITYTIPAAKKEIVVSGDTFPGTYYVTGDTYARSDVDGSDQFFQFIIPKAKVTSENTITLEAEGDPSVFSMNLTVLRPEDGEMMKLVQYDLTKDATASN